MKFGVYFLFNKIFHFVIKASSALKKERDKQPLETNTDSQTNGNTCARIDKKTNKRLRKERDK